MQIISRSEAIQLNLNSYFTGEPCKHGHIAERRTANYTCVLCCKNIAKKHYDKNKTIIKGKSKEYYKINSDKVKAYQKQYSNMNKDKINDRHHQRYNNDPDYKMKFRMRGMLRKILIKSETPKENDCYSLVGYTPSQLRRHLESLFKHGMTWDNHGEWHIDHIVPVSWWLKNGLTDPSMINALINLQPLWAKDNLIKSDKI